MSTECSFIIKFGLVTPVQTASVLGADLMIQGYLLGEGGAFAFANREVEVQFKINPGCTHTWKTNMYELQALVAKGHLFPELERRAELLAEAV